MNKKEVLKELFRLPKEEILDIYEIINGYKERVNKTNKDTLLARCVFASGYRRTKEFYTKNYFTKDDMYASALNYETQNIKAYLKLKDILQIDDDTFNQVLNEFLDRNVK